jgi:hypothetical protein
MIAGIDVSKLDIQPMDGRNMVNPEYNRDW